MTDYYRCHVFSHCRPALCVAIYLEQSSPIEEDTPLSFSRPDESCRWPDTSPSSLLRRPALALTPPLSLSPPPRTPLYRPSPSNSSALDAGTASAAAFTTVSVLTYNLASAMRPKLCRPTPVMMVSTQPPFVERKQDKDKTISHFNRWTHGWILVLACARQARQADFTSSKEAPPPCLRRQGITSLLQTERNRPITQHVHRIGNTTTTVGVCQDRANPKKHIALQAVLSVRSTASFHCFVPCGHLRGGKDGP